MKRRKLYISIAVVETKRGVIIEIFGGVYLQFIDTDMIFWCRISPLPFSNRDPISTLRGIETCFATFVNL